MFAVLVPEQPELWSEEFIGQRIWVTVDEARNLCQHWWMNEALDVLVERCTSSGTHEEEIPLFARQNSASQLIVASPEIENSYNMDIEPDNSNIEHITHDGTNGWSQKVTKLK
ncbi:hypothetical protein Pint_22386 [Pistacia integerrima]|uniref:Uncharacterized protein n=1 Tax=Pistacia integerrima TaxID=434235 RepID=A0ACC0YJ04_9ROSI|nr:hypothetical protein Pint_22386 [Pistacia integerrima]